MDKQETQGATASDWQAKAEREVATFSAVLPSVATAIRIHGDCGIRIMLDVDDEHIAEALKLVAWRRDVLEVTVRPK